MKILRSGIVFICLCFLGFLTGSVTVHADLKDLFGALTGGSSIQKDEEAQRLGTVFLGEKAIHLGDTPEQIHAVLGEPEDQWTMGSTLTESYPGLGIFYRDYWKLSQKYSWVHSSAHGEGEDYHAAMISILPPKDVSGIIAPYTTADGLKIYDFAPALEKCGTVFAYSQGEQNEIVDYNQIYYGEYYTLEDWKQKQDELKMGGDPEAYAKAQMEVVRVWYAMDHEKNQVRRIDVGDEMMAMYMR